MDADQYEVVIGLEVHAQLQTRTKLFCADTTGFGAGPNTQVSVVSLGHPGSLPRMNKEAITQAVKLGLACNCTIVRKNYFARKNYFYPDLPKGYQISQHTTPICRDGYLGLNIGSDSKKIRINRIHMEEDAGKSIHDENSDVTRLDFNRAGIPLLEIVTEPDIRSAEEAFSFLTTLRKLVRRLGVCDGNMEEGSFRCDVNISVRKKGDLKLGTRVEIKNLNSLRFIKKAIEYESHRLIAMHQKAQTILQETRGFDETDFSTYSIRSKEDEDDYRYFPEPDLSPFVITDDMIAVIKAEMPELPQQMRTRLKEQFHLSDYDAEQISDDSELSSIFFQLAGHTNNYKAAANWVIGPVKNLRSHSGVAEIEPANLADLIIQLINLIDEGRINFGIATQKIFPVLVKDPSLDIARFIDEKELHVQTAQSEIEELIIAALNKHSQKITEYKKGKKGLLSLFVGEVMKLSKGKADAQLVTEKIIERLKQS